MCYKGVIFDLNGVLFWDSHLQEMSWNIYAKELRGIPFSKDEIIKFVHGRQNKSVFEYILNRPLVDYEAQMLSQKKEALYRKVCLKNRDDIKLSPGAINYIKHLKNSHIPFTIATTSNKENLEFYIENLNLDHLFEISKIVYDDGSYTGTLHMFLKAAQYLSLDPHECIAIDDSKSGIAAAHAAKIGKIIGFGPKESHPYLKSLTGVKEVISCLGQILPN